jgi:hypothetical protein
MSVDDISMNQESVKSPKSLPTDISEQLTVFDRCNNEFIFIKKTNNTITFEYKPMQPYFSSSGTYSGGTLVFKKFATDEWAKLINVFQNAKANATSSRGRQMGSLVLEYQSGTTSDFFMIDMSSKINEELTTFFHSYKQ